MPDSSGFTSAVMNAALDCIVAADAHGLIVEFNPAAERTFGLARADAVGRSLADTIIPHAHRAAHEAGMARLAGGAPPRMVGQRIEIEGLRADGEVFPLELAIVRTSGAGDSVFVAYMRDITAQKLAEAELERSRDALHQAEKLAALGSLLAGVSHELNNPLSAVIGQAVMLEEDTAGTPLAERARKIRAAAERCGKIVQTFLAMARQGKPHRSQVDVNRLVRGVLDLTDYGLRTSGVEVRLDLAGDLPELMADVDLLHQVLANLIVNAQQALESQAGVRRLEVSTRCGRAPGSVSIRVTDNGPGVPAEIASRIFDPFFTSKRTGQGTGVGLSFSLGVVKAHGGHLRLMPSNAGATFEIELPSQPATPQPAERRTALPAAKGGRALVVDDEATVSETLAELLARQGFDVSTAADGHAAKQALNGERFDIILSDIRMPGLDGPGLFAWLQASRPELCARVGFVTGDTLGAGAARFLEESGRPYLEKPFTPASVADFLVRIRADETA
ncbi:MAG TPA: ATP-binding protein [Phenylobacterium sp.]